MPASGRALDPGGSIGARGKSPAAFERRCIPHGRRCSSVEYAQYAPSSRLATRAPRRSRCHAAFHHGLLDGRNRARRMGAVPGRGLHAGADLSAASGSRHQCALRLRGRGASSAAVAGCARRRRGVRDRHRPFRSAGRRHRRDCRAAAPTRRGGRDAGPRSGRAAARGAAARVLRRRAWAGSGRCCAVCAL